MTEVTTQVVPLRWVGDASSGHVEMLDQRLLPAEEVWLTMKTARDVADGIRDMVIRGAPAIGIAAAFGVYLGVREFGEGFRIMGDEGRELVEMLRHTRPTAVNLFWALERMERLLVELQHEPVPAVLKELFAEAESIMNDDRENNLEMGRLGADELEPGSRVLTHCNTGGLATGGYGTALGVIRSAHASGRLEHVWVDETRPYLQGARLTAWECMKDGIPSTLITDSMAGHFMKEGLVDAVIVGTDRVAANGDVANKIGTYSLAVLCRYHGIPFYVAAPVSTIDMSTPDGDSIEIEERSAEEITHIRGRAIAPEGVRVAHPAFDVTPAELVTAIITEKGVLRAPYDESLKTVAT